MKQLDEINYQSEEGKVFSRKSDGFIMGSEITLGIDDSIDKYEEVDIPEGFTDYIIESKRIEEEQKAKRQERIKKRNEKMSEFTETDLSENE